MTAKTGGAEVWLAVAHRPDRGAWAWASTHNGHGEGVEDGASAHRMDLKAAVEALQATKGDVTVISPNITLVQTGSTWLHEWRAHGWRKKGGIKNLDLVQALSAAMQGRTVSWQHVSSDDVRIEAVKERARAALEASGPAPAPGDTPAPGAESSKKRPAVAPTDAEVLVYTDGGCRGNPGGVGGWGALLVHVPTGKARSLRDGVPETTNNRMEMTGAIEALEAIAPGPSIEIRSDSKYLVDMATKWMAGWKKRGWKRGGNGEEAEIKNLDLVKRLDALLAGRRVRWTWVRGHAGEPGNELVDALTNAAMDDAAGPKKGRMDERLAASPFDIAVPGGRR